MGAQPSSTGRWGWLARVLAVGMRPDDDADLRIRKRTAVATVYALMLAGAFYAALGILADRPFVTVFSVTQTAVQGGALVLFHLTGRLRPVVLIMVAVGLLTIASGVVTLGGMNQSGGNLAFAILAPIGAVLLLGRRAAPPAFAAFAALVVWAAVTDAQWRATVSPVPDALSVPLYAMNLLVSGAIALGLVVFIDGERVRAKGQAESLLLNVLPRSIVGRLHAGERVIADHHPDVTVLFSDVVDFTPFAERQPPERVVAVLNELFSAFDALAAERGLEKIKTIGDAYMVVAGVPDDRPDHAHVMIEMALAMHVVAGRSDVGDGRRLELRTGIASGPVVAGVIGRQKFSYDLWGDTVNTASRMESSGVAGWIQVSSATYERCRARYPFRRRDDVEVKGKGRMTTWLLDPADVVSQPADAAADQVAADQQVQPVSFAQPSQQ
jgi:class 3 adenylate cyclase